MTFLIKKQKITKDMKEHPEKYIPKGMYCYTIKSVDLKTGTVHTNLCPFSGMHILRHHQSNGYCSYLKEGDWMKNSCGLLWDGCKSCTINDDWEE